MRLSIQLLFAGFVSIFLISNCQNQLVQEINASIKAKPVADAGASSIIRLPINKDTLRGTASSVNGAIVSYLWSLVSGPNMPIIVSSNASSTIVNNLVVGNYIFQFSVIDSDGYMGVDTVSVTVLPALQQTIVLQPTNNPNEVNFLFSPGLSINAPVTELSALSYTNGGTVIKSRAAFKFDLSSIPAYANLISARLSLYSSASNFTIPNAPPTAPNSGNNNGFWIQRITSNWNNNTTWALQPTTDTATQVFIPHTNLSSLDLGDINVKQMVDSIRATGNYGVIISLQNETNNNVRSFASSKHLDAGKHPKLVLVYQ
jgi:hypothetical protein